MNSEEQEKLAKQRFLLLSATRFIDLALVMAGIAILGGKFLPELAPVLGTIFLIMGAIGFFVVPIILKKAWAKQDGSSS
jgi:hypothetical protein